MKLKLLLLLFSCCLSWVTNAQNRTLEAQFEKYDIVQINSSQYSQNIRQNRSDIYKTNILGYDLQLFNSNIISPNYKVKLASTNEFLTSRRALPIPMEGTTSTGGRVSLTFNDGFIYGFIEDGDQTFFIEPLEYYQENTSNDLFVVYNSTDVKKDAPKTCGVTEVQERTRDIHNHDHNHGNTERMPGQCFEVEWAIASDFLMFQSHGSIAGVENHNIGVANNIQTNYDNEFADELQFFISEQFVSDCSSCDPWTSNTEAGVLLNSFTNWGPSGFSFSHDIGSLWTDRNFNGSTIGIAWVGVVCTGSRYNCLQDWSNNASLKRVMVAHEIGHNFDATHDGSGSPTIMAPSVNNTNLWSSQSESQIENHYLSRWCLDACSNSTAPVADFDLDYISQCVPGEVDFNDLSTGTVTAWEWDFPGGNPSTSTDQFPTVTYDNAGVYDVTLRVFNGALSDELTLNDFVEIFDLPVADFDYIDNGNVVNFTNLSEHATAYEWDFGDGNTSTEENPTHTYVDDGDYFVTLTVFSVCGTDFTSFNITIATPPTANFTVSPTEGCNPQVINFTSTSSNNTTDYFWEFEGGSPATSSSENPAVLYTQPGTFNVKLTVSNPQGEDEMEVIDMITIHESPMANFTYISNGTEVTFTNTSSGSDTYSWQFGDGSTSSEESPTHTYSSAGDYIVVLTASNPNCPDHTKNDTISLTLEPQAIIGINGNTEGCATFDVQFEDNSTSAPTQWQWTFEGGSPGTSNEENPMISYPTPGTYDVTLITTNSIGSDTVTMTDLIIVNTIPDVSYTHQSSNGIVSFTNTTTNASSYLWEFGDGNSSTDVNPIHNYMAEGTWDVKLTGENECGSFEVNQQVTTVLLPIANISVDQDTICVGTSVQYNDASQNTVTSWKWSFEGGNPMESSNANPLVMYDSIGVFDVTLIVGNGEGFDTIELVNEITTISTPSNMTNSIVDLASIEHSYTGGYYDSIAWELPDGNIINAANANYTVPENGFYDFALHVSNQCGSLDTIISTSINAYPNAQFTSDMNSGCANFNVQFATADVDQATFSWDFPGGSPSVSMEQNPEIMYTARGLYTVKLVVTNPLGSDTVEFVDYIEVEDLPEATFTANYDGIALSTTNNSQYANSYLWDFGNGDTSTEENPTYQYQNDGDYEITLISSNECGSDTFKQSISVVVLVPSIQYDMSIDSGCAPLQVQFTDMSGNNPTSYNWTFEGGSPSMSTEANPLVTYESEGTYSVTVEMMNAAGTSSLTQTDIIIVNDVPQSDFDHSSNSGEVTFNSTSSTNTQSYSWDFGDGNSSSEQNPIHTYSESGTYTVVLTTSNECGETKVEKTISVTISSSTEIEKALGLNVYPNPFNNQITLKIENLKERELSIQLLNKLGQRINKKVNATNSSNDTYIIDMLDQPAGIYLMEINFDGHRILKRMIKH